MTRFSGGPSTRRGDAREGFADGRGDRRGVGASRETSRRAGRSGDAPGTHADHRRGRHPRGHGETSHGDVTLKPTRALDPRRDGASRPLDARRRGVVRTWTRRGEPLRRGEAVDGTTRARCCARADGSGGAYIAQPTPRGRSDQWERSISPMPKPLGQPGASEMEQAGREARYARVDETRGVRLCCPGARWRDTAARAPVCIVRATPRAQASRRASEARAHARERRERRANRAFEGARFPRRGSFRATHRASRARASRGSRTPTRSRWGTRRSPRSRRRSTGCSATRRCGCARARRDASHPRPPRATLFPPSTRAHPPHVARLADPAPPDAGRHAWPRRRGQDHHPL